MTTVPLPTLHPVTSALLADRLHLVTVQTSILCSDRGFLGNQGVPVWYTACVCVCISVCGVLVCVSGVGVGV